MMLISWDCMLSLHSKISSSHSPWPAKELRILSDRIAGLPCVIIIRCYPHTLPISLARISGKSLVRLT